MTSVAQVDFTQPLQDGLATIINIVPAVLAFLAILIIGYIIAKLLAKALDAVLERVGFDRAVERGGVARAMERTQYDASDILSRIVFYALMLFVLQMAFGVFGPNPVSDLLAGVIAFLPRVFVAIIIVVIAAAVAAGAREIISATLGGLAYGRVLANAASGLIVAVGVFAALNQLQIAPAIVTGLFYALLAIIAGSTIIAVGGGGIMPMRRQWERAMDRLEEEAPKMREQVAQSSGDGGARTEEPAAAGAGRPGRRGNGGARRPERSERPEGQASQGSQGGPEGQGGQGGPSIRGEAEQAAPPGRRRPER